ncbi:hypothetical protein AMTRI_Chr10g231110 [Amborella trichopoda]
MEYEDLLLVMAEKLEADAFQVKLNGFKFLVDPSKGSITFESLKKNSTILALGTIEEALIHKI